MVLRVKDKQKYINNCIEANEVYQFIKSEQDKPDGKLKGKTFFRIDQEPFAYFSYFEAKALNRQSRTLTWLTIALFVTSAVLIGLTIALLVRM